MCRPALLPVLAVAFAGAAPAMPPEAADRWRSDLAFAAARMPELHANLFHSLPEERFGAMLAALDADLAGLEEFEAVVRLAEIVAAIGDGHSRLALPLAPAAADSAEHTATPAAHVPTFAHIPLRLSLAADGLVVVGASRAHAELPGAIVLAIEGQSPHAVLDRLGPVIHRDNEFQFQNLAPRFLVLPEVLAARGVLAQPGAVSFRLRLTNGRELSRQIEPAPTGVPIDWVALETPNQALRDLQPGRRYWLAPLDEQTVYFRLREILDDSDEPLAQFAQRLGEALRGPGIRRLVVDLRGNPGGNNFLNAPLVRTIIRAKRVWGPAGLFVLTDGGTFSAAMNLANTLEQMTPAIFVGDGTGASPNSYGDARQLQLPRTGLTIRLSTLYWQEGGPRDTRSAIEPLIRAPLTVEALLAGTDPALEAIASITDQDGTLPGRWLGHLSTGQGHADLRVMIEMRPHGLEGRIASRMLAVDDGPIVDLRHGPRGLAGTVELARTSAPIAARASAGRMAGWIDYQGHLLPFVVERTKDD